MDLDHLFVNAARALAEIMVDPTTVAPAVERTIELSARSPDVLLFEWLSRLIYLKDSERLVFVHSDVRVQERRRWHLTAQVAGGKLDRDRAVLRADVKTVALNGVRLEPSAHGWTARLVLDL